MTTKTDKKPIPAPAIRIRGAITRFGLPRIIIVSFLVFLWLFSSFLKIPFPALFSDSLVRLGMNGVLTLAMLPSILAGTGLFFGLPLGIICGLLGALISIELDLRGFTAFFTAIAISVPFSIVV